jgi:VanZ family protein
MNHSFQQQFRQALNLPDDPALAAPPAPVLHAAQYGWLTLGILVLTVYGSLIPFQFQPQSFADALASFRNITFAPLTDLGARADWNISVVLFALLSFLAMGMLSVDRARGDALRAAPGVIFFCAALGLLIEFLQTYFPPRTVSVNDLFVQAAGGVLGTLVWLVGGQRITRWARRLSSATGMLGLAKRLWPGYLVLLVIVQLVPFDFTLSAAELALKFEEGRVWLVPFAHPLSQGVTAII